jgi:hypothetical protein
MPVNTIRLCEETRCSLCAEAQRLHGVAADEIDGSRLAQNDIFEPTCCDFASPARVLDRMTGG